MIRNLPLFLALSLLLGCGQRQQGNTLSALFPETVSLTSRPLGIQADEILSPLYLASSEAYLICANFRTDRYVRIYDWKTGSPVNDLIHAGRGPGELLNVSSMSYVNDRLTLYSSNSQRILTIPGDELRKERPEMEVSDSIESCLRVFPLAYDQYLLEGCLDSHLKIVDHRGDSLSTFDPYRDNGEGLRPGEKRLIYQGQTAVSGDGKNIAFAASAGTTFQFGRVSGKGAVHKSKEYLIAPAVYTLDSDPAQERYSITWGELCPAGTLSVAAGSEHCFFLHDPDKLISDRDWKISTVLVFDWEGNPVVKFDLDRSLEAITLNEQENALIGLTSDDAGDPEFVSYRLPDPEAM